MSGFPTSPGAADISTSISNDPTLGGASPSATVAPTQSAVQEYAIAKSGDNMAGPLGLAGSATGDEAISAGEVDDKIAAIPVGYETWTEDDVVGGVLNNTTVTTLVDAVERDLAVYSNGSVYRLKAADPTILANWALQAVETTTEVAEGSNLYYTTSRADAAITARVSNSFSADFASTTKVPSMSAVYNWGVNRNLNNLTPTGINNFDLRVRTSRLSQMAAPNAAVSMAGQKLTNLGTPTATGDATTKQYVDGMLTNVYHGKGPLDCSTNPNYPAASAAYDTWTVTVAGKVGGASGVVVNKNDLVVAIVANAGGTQAAVGSSWFVVGASLAGALLASNNLSDLADLATALANLGLENVDNTSDADKPVSAAVAGLYRLHTVHGNPWENATRPDGTAWVGATVDGGGDVAIDQDDGTKPFWLFQGGDSSDGMQWVLLGRLTQSFSEILGAARDNSSIDDMMVTEETARADADALLIPKFSNTVGMVAVCDGAGGVEEGPIDVAVPSFNLSRKGTDITASASLVAGDLGAVRRITSGTGTVTAVASTVATYLLAGHEGAVTIPNETASDWSLTVTATTVRYMNGAVSSSPKIKAGTTVVLVIKSATEVDVYNTGA